MACDISMARFYTVLTTRQGVKSCPTVNHFNGFGSAHRKVLCYIFIRHSPVCSFSMVKLDPNAVHHLKLTQIMLCKMHSSAGSGGVYSAVFFLRCDCIRQRATLQFLRFVMNVARRLNSYQSPNYSATHLQFA